MLPELCWLVLLLPQYFISVYLLHTAFFFTTAILFNFYFCFTIILLRVIKLFLIYYSFWTVIQKQKTKAY
jgi:hypothetical protein